MIFVGDENAANIFEENVKQFRNGKCPNILVTGPHGCGKTYMINHILSKHGYTPTLLNITQFKQSHDQFTYLTNLSQTSDIVSIINGDKKSKIIIVDDGYINAFAQEKLTIASIIKMNKMMHICPIVCVFNKEHSKMINTIRRSMVVIKMDIPTEEDAMIILKNICEMTGIKIDKITTARNIIKFSQGDLRKLANTLNDLHQCSSGIINGVLLEKYLLSSTNKVVSLNLFEATSKLFYSNGDIGVAFGVYKNDRMNMPMMMHHNYPLCGGIIIDYTKLVKSISKGDIIDNFVHSEQRWDMDNVHGFYSCVVPSACIHVKDTTRLNISFPVDMNKTSVKKSNTKNIANASNYLNKMDSMDYTHVIKFIDGLLKSDNIPKVKEIMHQYGITLDKLENLIKIDRSSGITEISPEHKKKLRDI